MADRLLGVEATCDAQSIYLCLDGGETACYGDTLTDQLVAWDGRDVWTECRLPAQSGFGL